MKLTKNLYMLFSLFRKSQEKYITESLVPELGVKTQETGIGAEENN
jgi:hypothetical protein